MFTGLEILSLAFPVYDKVIKGIENYNGIKELLAGDSGLERLTAALKELYEEFDSNGFPDDVPARKKGLYSTFIETCKQLDQEIQRIKVKYQENLRLGTVNQWFLRIIRKSKLKKLTDKFESMLKALEAYRTFEQGLKIHEPDQSTLIVELIKRFERMEGCFQESRRARPVEHRRVHEEDIRVQKRPTRKSTYRYRRDFPRALRNKDNMEKCIDGRQKRGKCRNCGLFGHWERYCLKRCGNCMGMSHTATYCWGKGFCY